MKKLMAVMSMLCIALSVFAMGSQESNVSNGPVTITYYGRPDVEMEKKIIADFEAENPNIKVNYVELPSSSNDRLKTIQTVLQSGGTEMDVFAGDACWPAIFISADWIIPLDEYIDKEVFDGYIDTMLSAYTFNGKTYGLPYMADVVAMYYRSDLLEKYNLPVPTTYEEIIADSKIIMEGENDPDLYGWGSIWVQNESLTCCFLSFYWALGGPDMVDENGEFQFDADIAKQALELMRSFIYTEKISPEGMGSFDTNTMRNTVVAGDLIFTSDWLSGYAKYNSEGSAVNGKMKIASVPGNGALGGWGLMVSKFSEHPAEAAKFAEYRASYEGQKTAMQMVQQVPTLKEFYDPSSTLEGFEYIPEFLEPLSTARPRGLTPFYAEISSKIQVEASAVVTGMKTPEEAVESLMNSLNAIMY